MFELQLKKSERMGMGDHSRWCEQTIDTRIQMATKTAARSRPDDHRNETLWSRAGFLARRLHQIHVAIFVDLLAEHSLTPIQWGIITIVSGEAGLSFGEIAEALGIDRSNAADVCMRLAEKGILTLSSSRDDKRKKSAYLTKMGQNLMKTHADLVGSSQQRLLDPLNSAERKIFLNLLRRIVDHNNDLSRAPLRHRDYDAP